MLNRLHSIILSKVYCNILFLELALYAGLKAPGHNYIPVQLRPLKDLI